MKWEYLSFLAHRHSIIPAITLSVIASVLCVCLMPGTVLGTWRCHFTVSQVESLLSTVDKLMDIPELPQPAVQDLKSI